MSERFAINQETIDVLRQLAEQVKLADNNMQVSSARMISTFNEVHHSLGELSESVREMCLNTIDRNRSFSVAAIPIADKLNQISDQIEKILHSYKVDESSSNVETDFKPSEFSEVKLSAYKQLPPINNYEKLPVEYIEQLTKRYKQADPFCRTVFERYRSICYVQDTEYTKVPCFKNNNQDIRGIYYSAINDMINPKGEGTTFYHEIGHMIDFAASDFCSCLSDNPKFIDALWSDGASMLKRWDQMNDCQREKFKEFLYDDTYHSMSDLLYPLTSGIIKGKWGHSSAYWYEDETRLQKEAFAHFFEAGMGNVKKQKILQKVFPSASAVFNCIMKAQSNVKEELIHG